MICGLSHSSDCGIISTYNFIFAIPIHNKFIKINTSNTTINIITNLVNKIELYLRSWVLAHMSQITTALTASLLVIFGDDVIRIVKNQVRHRHFLIRMLTFVLLCAFGFGMLAVFVAPGLARMLRYLGDRYVVLVVVAVLEFVKGVLSIVRAFLLALPNPWTALVWAAYELLKTLIDDLLNTGVYLYYDAPGLISNASTLRDMGVDVPPPLTWVTTVGSAG